MGLFDFFKKEKKEQTKNVDGYEIGIQSGIIYHCPKGLTKYTLPEGTKEISLEACRDMKETMENLEIPSTFPKFDARSDLGFLLNNAKNFKNIHFAEGIKSITIGDLAKHIEFNIPKSVTHLGYRSYIPSENGKLIIGKNINSISSMMASHDNRLTDVEFQGNMEEIPSGAFNQCRNLNTFIIKDGIKTCGAGLLRGTNKLQYLEIPDGFNGKIDAGMELRQSRTIIAGKEYFYSGVDFEKEKNNKVTINITREGKKYSFQILRGDFSNLSLAGNKIAFNELSVDISKLNENDLHTIADGKITSIAQKSSHQQFTDRYRIDTKTQPINPQIDKSIPTQSRNILPTQESPVIQGTSQSDQIKLSKELAQIQKYILNKFKVQELSMLDGIEHLSHKDSILLAIALEKRKGIYAKLLDIKEDTALDRTYKSNVKLIKQLRENGVIPRYYDIHKFDQEHNEYWSKKFDMEIKQMQEEHER